MATQSWPTSAYRKKTWQAVSKQGASSVLPSTSHLKFLKASANMDLLATGGASASSSMRWFRACHRFITRISRSFSETSAKTKFSLRSTTTLSQETSCTSFSWRIQVSVSRIQRQLWRTLSSLRLTGRRCLQGSMPLHTNRASRGRWIFATLSKRWHPSLLTRHRAQLISQLQAYKPPRRLKTSKVQHLHHKVAELRQNCTLMMSWKMMTSLAMIFTSLNRQLRMIYPPCLQTNLTWQPIGTHRTELT